MAGWHQRTGARPRRSSAPSLEERVSERDRITIEERAQKDERTPIDERARVTDGITVDERAPPWPIQGGDIFLLTFSGRGHIMVTSSTYWMGQ